MSFTLMCCNNCGRVGKHTLLCEDCDGVAYCSLTCRVDDTLCHEQYCEAYRKRRISKCQALSDAKADITILFMHVKVSHLIKALYEAWDPFHTGYITCTIMRCDVRPAQVSWPRRASAQYLVCQVQFTSGLTNANRAKRVVKTRYIHTGASSRLPVIYTMDVTYNAKDGPDSYCKLCGDRVLDILPCSEIFIDVVPTTGSCELTVDGKAYTLW